jgi:ribosomal protein L17
MHRALMEHCSSCPAKEKCAEIQKHCEELIEIAKENPIYYRQGELLRHVDMPWTMEGKDEDGS